MKVSRSVCLGVEPHLGPMTRCVLTVWQLLSCPVRAPSLRRGRVCVFQSYSVMFFNMYMDYIQFCMSDIVLVHTLYARPLSVQARYSRLCPINFSLSFHGNLDTWRVVEGTAAKFKPLTLSNTGFALSNVAIYFFFFHFHVFEWPLLAAYIISLCNHTRTEFGKPHANGGPMCTLGS
jgi:hypothetical protein